MAKVIAPNNQYSGLSAGVAFVNGVGETDNAHLLEWFEEKGYTVEWPVAEPEKPAEESQQPPAAPEAPPEQQKKGK